MRPDESTAPPVSKPTGRQVRAFGPFQYGLEGMRGYLIFCVLLYHGRLGPYEGMYLMLSLFFVLSGFLITALLLDDRERAGKIDYKRFIARRVRRLAPAAFGGVLLAVIYGATLASRSQAEQLTGDIIGVVFYVVNWTFVFTEQSYTDAFSAPSPVQHYWSLAVEEQFYVVIPVLLGLLLRFKVPYRIMVGSLASVILGSTLWLRYLYADGADINRLYFGTDTRIAEVMVGVLLAVVMDHRNGELSERTRWFLSRAGWPAMIALGYLWTTYGVTEPFSYQGGFLLNALLTAVLIMAVIAQRGLLHRVYTWGPAIWVGGFSYGIYIYHFVILLWLTPARTGLAPWPNLGLVTAITMVIAWASNKYYETPIRKGATFRLPTTGQAVIYPVVGLALIAGAFATANTDGDDPLATLRDDGRSLRAPVATEDGVLDILVVHSAENAEMVDRLETVVSDDDQIRVAARQVFSCDGGTVELASGPTCANWADEWPTLIETHDPDTVVFFVDGWAGDDLEALGEEGATAQETSVALLDTGFDLLSANGASIVASGRGLSFVDTFRRSFEPFFRGLGDLGLRRDVNVVEGLMPDPETVDNEDYLEESAGVLIDMAALYQRADRDAASRVLIVGDSQARSLGYGLERWGADHGVWVWNVATNGCGIADEGFKFGSGEEAPISDECVAAVDAYASQIASFDPEIVVVFSSAWDLGVRRLAEWDEALRPGDELFDAYVIREYEEAIATFTSRGARVVWMQAPCFDRGAAADPAAVNTDWIDEEELDVLNGKILPQLEAAHPGEVALYDLEAILCPDGEPLREVDGISPIRGDGVHFNIEGSSWFAEVYGAEMLELGGIGG